MKMKTVHAILTITICLGLVFSWGFLQPAGPALAQTNEINTITQDVYSDQLAQGWNNFSWGTVNLSNTIPVYSGTYSIKADLGGFTGIYLYFPGLFPDGLSTVTFFIHGGATGGQQLDLYLKFFDGVNYVEGPRYRIPTLAANIWQSVSVPFSSLQISGLPVTGILIQNAIGSTQPTFYVDAISLVSETNAAGPTVSSSTVNPRAVIADGKTNVAVSAQISDPQGMGDIDDVYVDGSHFGQGNITLLDNGMNFDGSAGDGRFGAVFSVAETTPAGEYAIAIHAVDHESNHTIVQAGALTVLAQPGGSVPAGLPDRLGWGDNAWTGSAGYDWNAASGVPWDYNYLLLPYDWYTGAYGTTYVTDYVSEVWSRGEIPVISVYFMLGLANCGETAECYVGALKDQTKVSTYISALTKALQDAGGAQPVIFNLEPDFIGFMQQYTNSPTRPEGVQPDDPHSVPVGLNRAGYEDTLAGFGQYIIHLVHTVTTNALAAPMVSWWGTGDDPFETVPERVIQNAQRMANFTLEMGGDQADLLVTSWGDRDAGSGEVEFWDTTNLGIPRPTRANLWENALSASSGKRILLWQMPAGNMTLDNTPQHYQDNRAAYVFSHPRDLFDSGVIGVLFGGGNTDMTQVWTDGDFIKHQAATAYAAPAAPTGLSIVATGTCTVTLRWTPSPDVDVWGYILEYTRAGGSTVEVDLRRVSSAFVVIAVAGSYTATVHAYDAMGTEGASSGSVSFTTTQDAFQVYLPVGMKRNP